MKRERDEMIKLKNDITAEFDRIRSNQRESMMARYAAEADPERRAALATIQQQWETRIATSAASLADFESSIPLASPPAFVPNRLNLLRSYAPLYANLLAPGNISEADLLARENAEVAKLTAPAPQPVQGPNVQDPDAEEDPVPEEAEGPASGDDGEDGPAPDNL